MRCKYCGSSVEEEDIICLTCGRPLTPEGEAMEKAAIEEKRRIDESLYGGTEQNGNERSIGYAESRDNIAIASLVFGIISIILCGIFVAPAGIVLGVFGLKSNKKELAVVGLVLSIVAVILFITVMIISISMAISSGAFNDLSYYYR